MTNIGIDARMVFDTNGNHLNNVNTQLADIVINVSAFGAKGDGVTDDSAAIQNAITTISNNGGGVLEFSEGKNYLISQQFLLPSDITIRGKGSGCKITVDQRNWTGGITHFYAIFSTVNVNSRPQDILWRYGTGTISHYNIVIENIEFHINRDASVVTSSEMSTAEFNAVRFEDAQNCKVKNCRFIDLMTSANNNGGHVIHHVRSNYCTLEDSYFQNCTPIEIDESTASQVKNNIIRGSIGTTIETMAGERHLIEGNDIDTCVWNVSVIALNSIKSTVKRNRIAQSQQTGITLGHDEPEDANHYNVSPRADYSTCSHNIIEGGSNAHSSSGLVGIIVQNGAHVTIEKNFVTSLQGSDYTQYQACILVNGGGTIDRFTHIQILKNTVTGGTSGIMIPPNFEDILVEENHVTNCIAGIQFPNANSNTSTGKIKQNYVSGCTRGINAQSGFIIIEGNTLVSISDASYTVAMQRGYFIFRHNRLHNCGEVYMNNILKLIFKGNMVENDSVKNRVGIIYNTNTAGTATLDQIAIEDNIHTGTTYNISFLQVVGQTDGYVEKTKPANVVS